jgi:hypothetical protein
LVVIVVIDPVAHVGASGASLSAKQGLRRRRSLACVAFTKLLD